MNNKNLNVIDEMYYGDLWIKLYKNSRREILTKDEIEKYNEESIKRYYINDIFSEKNKIGKDAIVDMINEISKVPKVDRYKNGNKVKKEYYDRLIDNLNLEGLRDEVQISYGILIKRAKVKTFPTSDKVFKNQNDYELDRFMETAVYPTEPCIVYARSKDGKWYFCKTYNYSGWVKSENVAIGDKKEIEGYCSCEDFIVVTGKKIHLGYNPFMEALRGLDIDMGVRLPIEKNWNRKDLVCDMYCEGNYIVKYPLRDCDGKLKFTHVLIPYNEDVHEGYLKCSRGNILKQIFKFQGERYGWGGEFDGRDCSSLILDVFRCFGIRLPRNSGDQLKNSVGEAIIIGKEISYHERIKILESLKPGALIFLDGHVGMFIGQYKNDIFIIHDTIGVYVNKGKEKKGNKENNNDEDHNIEKVYLTIKGVTVCNLKEIYTSSGNSYIDSIVGVKDILG
ncbi:SH3 domain-containing protein [Clostridium sp.]|uniref:SH3 domain-containing protein n=1 Tax=Clostridium sp. TaxID=1506 RepID=UPI0032165DB7